ncbi:hypothetical protein [Paenibacillus thermotolerans]|uniref:hypothetical protein n=1 Tax=Paenibacillus thermotolerans TaxID=3027807 RepID=UPI0023685D01|nr:MULTISPECIES: hypothetical protein [unclassified Paenibacillus]
MFEQTSVNIGIMKLNNVDQLSNVSIGQNQKINRNVYAKKTQGFGQQHADRAIRVGTIHMTLDEDVMDKFTVKNDR